jgi:hypothetical protein
MKESFINKGFPRPWERENEWLQGGFEASKNEGTIFAAVFSYQRLSLVLVRHRHCHFHLFAKVLSPIAF